MKMIDIQGMSCRYGKKEALHPITLELQPGSILGLLGPNGAGKTTTLLALMGLIPYQGKAQILGVDCKRIPKSILQQIGYVSESQRIPDHLTVREFLNLCASVYPTWDQALEKKLIHLVDLFDNEIIASLSRGTQMKVKLVSSLAYRPKLLVMDEPFTGLDPVVRNQLIQGVLELSDQEGWSVIISSHDMEEVERLVDQIAILKQGTLCIHEKSDELLGRFRRIEAMEESERSAMKLLGRIPKGWIQNGRMISWVEENYQGEESEVKIRAEIGESALISPMTLKEIFIHVAGNGS
jgi:ABC-2 type transport system ATP-binding protein